jgi:hypothetical protein
MDKEYSLRNNTWQIYDNNQKAWVDVVDTADLVETYDTLLEVNGVDKNAIEVQGCRFTENQYGTYRGFVNFIDEKGWNKVILPS